MAQIPRSVGLFLCDQVIFERRTNKPSLIGCFTGMQVEDFPADHQRFDVFTALIDGIGTVTLDLEVVLLDLDQQVYAYSTECSFPDPLQVVNARFQVHGCPFPEPGTYLFTLSADGEEIASRRLHVYSTEEDS